MKTIKRFTERSFDWMSDASNADRIVGWTSLTIAVVLLTTGIRP